MSDLLDGLWERVEAFESICTGDEVMRMCAAERSFLVETGIIKRTTNSEALECDTCGELLDVISLPGRGGRVRPFLNCPEDGAAPIEEGRLFCWEIDFGVLVSALARALSTVGMPRELLADRLWLVGSAALGGESREVFFARGIPWPDANAVFGAAVELGSEGKKIVFAASRAPSEWAGAAPPTFDLRPIVGVENGRFSIDREAIDRGLPHVRRARRRAAVASFPTPAGVSWEDVTLTVRERDLDVAAGGISRTLGFAEAGFEEGRTGQPDRAWNVLRVLAQAGDRFPARPRGYSDKETDALRHHVSTLRARLRQLMQIEEDPFFPSRFTKTYRPRFRLLMGEGTRFPTPEEARWDGVGITELASGKILMSVEGLERVRATRSLGGEGSDEKEDETAQKATTVSLEYTVATLGLLNGDGSPNTVARTLVRLLREGGKARAPKLDPALVALDDWLSGFFGLDPPAFQYATQLGTWVALFSAESKSGR